MQILNLIFEGELDGSYLVKGEEKEVREELEKVREVLQGDDYEPDISDMEMYEEALEKRFGFIKVGVINYDY